MQLSVLLPCYNEAEAIPSVLTQLLADRKIILASTPVESIEIVVIDDGSTDQSLSLLSKYQSEIRILSFPENKGYGQALKVGFQEAKGDLIAFYDLDGTCQPQDLVGMIHLLSSENAGMVCGDRLHRTSEMPLLRKIGNWVYRTIGSFFLGQEISDCCTGMRLFRREYVPLFCHRLPDKLNFSLAMTLVFLKSGGKYLEYPIQYRDRLGSSKLIPLTDGPLFLWTLLRYCLESSSNNRFTPSSR